MDTLESKILVYTAQSKHFFHARFFVVRYALERGVVPLNPFNLWGYFLYDTVGRDLVRRGNNNVIRVVDEVWVFGPIADGIVLELDYAMELQKQIRYFSLGSSLESIQPLAVEEVTFEPNALVSESEDTLRARLLKYGYTHLERDSKDL